MKRGRFEADEDQQDSQSEECLQGPPQRLRVQSAPCSAQGHVGQAGRAAQDLERSPPKIGRYDYKFAVEFPTEEIAKRALEIINNAKEEWKDLSSGVVGVISARIDKCLAAHKANKVYGELRKL